GERDGAIGDDERTAHGIAEHLHAALRHLTAAAAARRALDDAVEQAPECPGDEECQDDEERQPQQHQDPGLRVPPPPVAGCGDCRLSSARFAACASGLPGATSITFCHACSAPSRSCFPKARTMPWFSSVLACFGSILSEWSNCSSALSGWFE